MRACTRCPHKDAAVDLRIAPLDKSAAGHTDLCKRCADIIRIWLTGKNPPAEERAGWLAATEAWDLDNRRTDH